MALYPFILISKKDVPFYTLNHERIHHKQQLELLLVFFYLWYFLEFAILFLKHKNRKMAYMNISFEKEAYHNHKDIDYLNKRKAFSFLNYYKFFSNKN